MSSQSKARKSEGEINDIPRNISVEKAEKSNENNEAMFAPYFVGKENEPEDIKQDCTEKEDSIGTAETLAAALDGYEGEQ